MGLDKRLPKTTGLKPMLQSRKNEGRNEGGTNAGVCAHGVLYLILMRSLAVHRFSNKWTGKAVYHTGMDLRHRFARFRSKLGTNASTTV